MAAEEIKKILTIDTTSLKEYKKHIDELRGSLLQLDKDSEDYKEIEAEITKETNKLNEVLKTGKKQVDYVSGSYFDLNKQLVEAKKQWKALSEEERNSDVGKALQSNINNLDKQLKDLDSSIGQYQRNVGNYGSAFSSAFKNAKDSLVSAVPGVGKFNNALKLLLANPVGAVIGAIALAVTAVVKAMKGSESQMNRWKVATSGLKVITDGFKNALSAVANAVVTLAEKASNLIKTVLTKAKDFAEGLGWEKMANRIGNVINKIEDYQELEQKNVDLASKRRQVNIDIAKTENQIADLRAKLAEKDKYNEEERLKLVQQWEAAEKRRASLAVSLAQEEYNLIKRNNALTESGTADLDAENDAYVNLIKAQGEYSSSLRSINAEKAKLLGGKVADAVKEETAAIEDNTEALIQQQLEAEKAYQKKHEEQVKSLEAQHESNLFYTELEIDNEQQKADAIYEINKQLLEDKITLQEEYIKNFIGGIDEQLKAEQQLSDLREELNRLNLTNTKRVNKQIEENEKITQQNKINYAFEYMGAMSSLFSALSDLSEEGSEEQKAFAVMAATLNTLASVVGVIYSVWTDPTIPSTIAKAALSVTLSAGVLASGLAQVNKIKNTNKNSGTSSLSGGVAETLPNVGVNPLLNEEQDIQGLQSLTVTGDSEEKGTRVYVVESDITQAQNTTKTKVSNSTF